MIARFVKQNKAVMYNAWSIDGWVQKSDIVKKLSRFLSRRGSFTGELENFLAYLPDGKASDLCRSLTSFKAEEKKVICPALNLRLTQIQILLDNMIRRISPQPLSYRMHEMADV